MKALFVLSLSLLALVASAKDNFDFFYLVQQWPGSYCDTKRACCYPVTGKPDPIFTIHGLWPNYNDGTYPSNCDQQNEFDGREIEDLQRTMEEYWPTLACPTGNGLKFWAHEWDKHGTCTESTLDQHSYFLSALNLYKKANLLTALQDAGIEPDDRFYSVDSIKLAIKESVGFTPGLECNKDGSGNQQLSEVYLCVDKSGQKFINCPNFPRISCRKQVQFPSF
ncbi:extracellular ribonuclease LE-like protein [Carex littledalei]|uniref:Extracellular ribonuclease LE-like protein n=1 Tax=Carex littledalei TaxID=544730 RepID=A0A833VDV3_9POAL|nr:extracellular ribonuclease LE-like protein [Carex littledalei]